MKKNNNNKNEEKYYLIDTNKSIFKFLDSSFKMNVIWDRKCMNYIQNTHDLTTIKGCAKITNYHSMDYKSAIIPIEEYNNIVIYYYTDFIRLVFNKVDSNAYLFFRNKGDNANYVTISKLNKEFKIKCKFLISNNNTIKCLQEFDYKNMVKTTYSSSKMIYLDSLNSINSIDKLFDNKNEFQKLISKEKIKTDSIISWLDNIP